MDISIASWYCSREALTVRGVPLRKPLALTHRESTPRRDGVVAFHPNNLEQIGGHVFYLALGYFVSYLPYAVLAKALSIGIVPGVVGAVAALSLPAHRRGPGRAMAAEPIWLLAGGELDAQGAAMTDAAAAILQDAGIFPHRPRSRRRTPELCRPVERAS